MAIATICISLLAVAVSSWSVVSTYRSYEWLRWRVTRLGIEHAREDRQLYRHTGLTSFNRNLFSGSYKRRYHRAYMHALTAKEIY